MLIPSMYSRRFDTSVPNIREKLLDFFETRDFLWNVENDPTGWATLTVCPADPQLHEDLDNLFRRIETE
jgi:hypothetical protein